MAFRYAGTLEGLALVLTVRSDRTAYGRLGCLGLICVAEQLAPALRIALFARRLRRHVEKRRTRAASCSMVNTSATLLRHCLVGDGSSGAGATERTRLVTMLANDTGALIH